MTEGETIPSGPASAPKAPVRAPSLRDQHVIVRVATLAATGAFVALAVWNLAILVPQMIRLEAAIGVDYVTYMDAAGRWLAGGSFYLARQLAGPYQIQPGDILYPPTILWLLVPFRSSPAFLWWAIPTATIAVAIWRVRPAWWLWPVLAFILWYPRTQTLFLYGNPGIWVIAAVALSTRWRAASVLAFLKPTFAFLALFGVRHRSWWAGLAILILMSAVLTNLWTDYVAVVTNSDVTLAYSYQDLPPTLAPILAWLARTRSDPR